MDNTHKNVYEKLEAYVLNGSNGSNNELSINEYKSLFGIHNNLKGRINNSIIIELIKGLENNSLNANKLLDVIIEGVSTDEHLLMLALLLRNGGNPNKLVPYNNMEVSLLGYVHIIYHNNICILNTILLLLLLSGADPNLEVFKNSGLSIINWLKEKSIDSILLLDKNILFNNLDIKLSNKVCTLLNKPELLKNFDNINITETIRDHSNKLFSYLIPNINELNKNGRIIDLCIKYYNEKAFSICMNYGIKLRYYQINILMLQIKLGESIIIKNIIKNMLSDYINHGGTIDKYQADIIDGCYIINKNITDNYILGNLINSGYDNTLYIKKCYIEHGATYGNDARIINPKKGTDFIDLSIINNVSITPNMFEDIIGGKKVNLDHLPHLGVHELEFSSEYLNSLYLQRTLLKRLGFNINNSKSIIKSNFINEERFIRLEKAFLILIKLNLGINADKLSMMNMEDIIKQIEGSSIPLLNMLTIEHYRRTFAITCYEQATYNLSGLLSCFK